MSKMIELSSPKATDDFTLEFEFIDEMRLRIRANRGALEEYDLNFNREGAAPGVPIPTNRIPPAVWPAALLSPDMPAYTGDRIRRVYSSKDEDLAPEYLYWYIDIDRTTQNRLLEYVGAIRQAGWTGPGDTEILEKMEQAKNSMYSVLSTTYNFQFRKGCYTLFFNVYSEDSFQVASLRVIEGRWLSEVFTDEFKPPANVIYIGETKLDDFKGITDEDYYGTYEIDFYPGKASAYMSSLMSKGFAATYASYDDNEVFKFIRIGGKMYKVSVEMGYSDNDTIVKFRYWLKYFPDMTMPSKIPQGIAPPSGFELFRDYSTDIDDIMNDTNTFGSFKFCVINMTESQKDAYFSRLEQDGWDQWGSDYNKDIQWNGHNWYCTIGGGYEYDGMREFSATFMLND